MTADNYGQWAPDDPDRMVFMLTFKDKRFVEFSCMMGVQLDEMEEEYKPYI